MRKSTPPDDKRLSLPRRRLLATGSVGIAALAGCSGTDDDDEDDQPEDTEPPEDDEPDEDDEEAGEGADDEGEEAEEDADDQGEEAEDDEGSPSFEITDVEHPDEVETGEEHEIVVTVENTGDAAGDFEELLELSVAGEDEWENVGNLTIDNVAPDETGNWTLEEIAFDDPATVQYRLGETQWEYDVTITEPSAQSFSGSGQSVEDGIDIEGGLIVVEASHDGESNFQVSLADDSDFDDSFVNVIGSFDGAQADLIDEGEYLLDVNADGNWDVTIRQPRTGQGDELPTTIAGSGPDVSEPIMFSGTSVATGDHDGDSNFQVQIYPMTGSFGESVFNEIGEFEGETTYSFDGIGWVDVNADGSWSVELE